MSGLCSSVSLGLVEYSTEESASVNLVLTQGLLLTDEALSAGSGALVCFKVPVFESSNWPLEEFELAEILPNEELLWSLLAGKLAAEPPMGIGTGT